MRIFINTSTGSKSENSYRRNSVSTNESVIYLPEMYAITSWLFNGVFTRVDIYSALDPGSEDELILRINMIIINNV